MKREYTAKQLQLLETAELLFSKKGFDGTSVRDIAEEAGINTAMISYYFGSKEKLMEAIFELRAHNLRTLIDQLQKDSNLSPVERIYMLVQGYVQKIMEQQQFHRIMFCEQVINKNPVIINMVERLKKKNASGIHELIKDGQKKGVFKKNVDILLLMNTLFGTVTYALVNKNYYRSYHELESLPDDEFDKTLQKRLTVHIKNIFKAILTHEA